VAQVTQVGPLRVLGHTPFGTEMPGKSHDRVSGFSRGRHHVLTLTKGDPIGKDIDAERLVSWLAAGS